MSITETDNEALPENLKIDPVLGITSKTETFPQQIEVTFTLKLIVNEQPERDFWLEPGTTNVTLYSVADIFDILSDCYPTLESVNNFTYWQIQQAMSERDI